MKDKLGDNGRLRHMLESVEEIEAAVKGLSYDEFVENHVIRIAVVKWIEIIGEASVYISEELKDAHRSRGPRRHRRPGPPLRGRRGELCAHDRGAAP